MGIYFKKRKIKNNLDRNIDIEEIFLDKISFDKEREKGIKARRFESPLNKLNFVILSFAGVILLLILLTAAFKLQIRDHKIYSALAKENKFIVSYLDSERGVIYDRNMKQLVFNKIQLRLYARKSEISDNNLKKIAQLTNQGLGSLKEKIKKSSGERVLLGQSLSHKNLIFFETEKSRFPGLEIEKRVLRDYETEGALGNILGYLGKISAQEIEAAQGHRINDYIGKEGLERSYQDALEEKKGKILIEKTARGERIGEKIVNYAKSGNSLVLFLDFSLQKKIEESLKGVIAEVGSRGGAAVALNPQNGAILASVSLPSLKNNLFAKGISQEELNNLNKNKEHPQLNRVISAVYPMGSTVKPLIGSAALQEGIIKESTRIFAPLKLCLENIYSKRKECFPDWKFHGWSNIKKALAESINPFFYIIGGGYVRPDFADKRLPKNFVGLGINKIKKYLTFFGLGEKSGIDLPGESKGRVPDPAWKKNYFENQSDKIWHIGDTYHLSIGQGSLLATPIQVVRAISTIANGGKLFRPEIVKSIIGPDGQLVKETIPKIERENFISSKNLNIIKEGMKQAVDSPAGSAFSLSFLPVSAAAKTGTAQTGKKDTYYNWIVAFAPYENPKIVLAVIIENVKGTKIAAQAVAKEVLAWYFRKK